VRVQRRAEIPRLGQQLVTCTRGDGIGIRSQRLSRRRAALEALLHTGTAAPAETSVFIARIINMTADRVQGLISFDAPFMKPSGKRLHLRIMVFAMLPKSVN